MDTVTVVSVVPGTVGVLLLFAAIREFFWPKPKADQSVDNVKREAMMLTKQASILITIAAVMAGGSLISPALGLVSFAAFMFWLRVYGPRLTR